MERETHVDLSTEFSRGRESISKPRLSTGSSPVRKDAVTSGFVSDLFNQVLEVQDLGSYRVEFAQNR